MAKREVDLYLDLSTQFYIQEEHLVAIAKPSKKMAGYDRFRITVRIDEKYFSDDVDGTLPLEKFVQVEKD